MIKYLNIPSVCITVMFLLFVSGCKKDLGNYTYTDINKVTIKNIEKSYTASYLEDTLKIVPKLSFTLDKGDLDRYEYEWLCVSDNVSSSTRRTVIGTSRNLNYAVNMMPGTYVVYYRVTDKETGVNSQQFFKLVVITSTYEGWVVLTNVDNRSVLSMVSINNNGTNVIKDALVASGMPAQEGPRKIVFSNMMFNPPENLALLSNTGAQRIDPIFFNWAPEMNVRYEMLEQTPADFAPQLIYPVDMFSEFLVNNNGDLYFKDPMDGNSFSAPRNRIEGQSNSSFKVAPYIAHNNNTYAVVAVVYDTTNKRFVRLGNKAAACTIIPDGKLFSFSTGRELMYMSNSTFNNYDTFAILKDKENKVYLYRFNVGTQIAQSYYDVMSAQDIDKASLFAVHPSLGYVFYAVGSKVYEYDMNNRSAKLMLDFGNKEVTMLKFNTFTSTAKYYKPVYKDLELQLLVGSVDHSLPKDSQGKLSLYEVPPVNQPLVLLNEYNGMGRIVDVAYRERN